MKPLEKDAMSQVGGAAAGLAEASAKLATGLGLAPTHGTGGLPGWIARAEAEIERAQADLNRAKEWLERAARQVEGEDQCPS